MVYQNNLCSFHHLSWRMFMMIGTVMPMATIVPKVVKKNLVTDLSICFPRAVSEKCRLVLTR